MSASSARSASPGGRPGRAACRRRCATSCAPRPAAPACCSAAAVAALAWANIDLSSYESVWHTELSIQVGASGISQDLREWVNSGLMTFFFFVVGLEARREFDVGELRERRRLALPVLAGARRDGGPGRDLPGLQRRRRLGRTAGASRCRPTPPSRSGCSPWSGRGFPDRLRGFLLTIIVVDDVVALLRDRRSPTASDVAVVPLLVAVGDLRPDRSAVRAAGVRHGLVYFAARRRRLGRAVRVGRRPGRRRPRDRACSPTPTRPAAASSSGRPTCSGSSASSRRRSSRARRASGLQAAISPNERLQQLYHPWTSYVIVPLFALANVGIAIDGDFLSQRLHLADHARDPGRLRARQAGRDRRRLLAGDEAEPRPAAAAGRLGAPSAGGGAIAGIGFTVSLLIATLAFDGAELRGGEARRAQRRALRLGR